MPHRTSDARERIVQAALGLFAARGYHNTGIADILRESGVNRGSLYHYFSSKKELGFAAIDEMLRLVAEEGGGRHFRTNDHAIDKLLKTIDEMPSIVKLDTGEPLPPSITARLATSDADFRERLATGYAALIDEIEALVRRGVAEGQIADSVDPRVLTRVFVVMAEGIQLSSVLGQGEDFWGDARRWLKEYLNSLRA